MTPSPTVTLSPLYSYVQLLINDKRAFTIKLQGGDQYDVPVGGASFAVAGALLLQVGFKTIAVEETGVVYIIHPGNPAT